MREIGFTSMIVVPLVARERTLGVITLVTAESGRRYGEADLELAEELARRAAWAGDNARVSMKRHEVRFAVGIFRDITERKQAEDARARVAAIVESSDDAIIGKTLDRIIISWNQGAQRIYSYSLEEVVGRPLNILVPPDRPNEIPMILERLRHGEAINHYETRAY